MGGFSPMHMGLVLVIALLVFGPKKLPEIGRELGQAIREFKKASREVMDSFHDAAEDRPPGTPAYDSYHAMPYEDTSYPHEAAPALAAPPHAEGPAVPAAPPAGTVDRSAPAVASPVEAATASPAAALIPAESSAHEPARDPAASERNT